MQLNPAQPTRALPFFTVPPRLRHIQVQHAACTPRTCCMHASHMLHARSAHADAVDTQRCHIQMPAHSRGEIFGAAILLTAPPRLRHIRVQHTACTPRTCCTHASHMLHARSAHADAVDTQRCHIQMPAHSRGEIFGAAILLDSMREAYTSHSRIITTTRTCTRPCVRCGSIARLTPASRESRQPS